eukprot:TRINITY_DN76928_c0_g1_i1.p1 TRINITY_DN76928_c0_g1~~TRINITY_DN76928_c0_g1_i1.p1  ORF type:complete len:510 (+),score=129.09 TRINITY_DN76928_c0_g1_i1:27-1556(+)
MAGTANGVWAASDLEDQAVGARARFEASLGTHRAKIATLRQLEVRLNERIRRLGELSQAARELQAKVEDCSSFKSNRPLPAVLIDVENLPTDDKVQRREDASSCDESSQPSPADTPTFTPSANRLRKAKSALSSPTSPPISPGMKRSVSWGGLAREEWTQSVAQFPAHGHWVPDDILDKRVSFQGEAAKKLGGREVQLEIPSKDQKVPCLLVEPMGKLLSPSEYVSTGLAIILQGLPQTEKSVEEWVQVLKRTKVLDAGISVALPDIWQERAGQDGAQAVEDMEEVVCAAMAAASASSCVLCGKARGAQAACELTAAPALAGRVAGCVLLAPKSPPPRDACSAMPGPVMLVWAQDDATSPFSNAESWAEALSSRSDSGAVAVLRDPKVGAHDFARVFRKDEKASADFLSFVAASLLIAELKTYSEAEQVEAPTNRELPTRIVRLCEELPPFLAMKLGKDGALDDNEDGRLTAALELCCTESRARGMKLLTSVLRNWIDTDMSRGASASE